MMRYSVVSSLNAGTQTVKEQLESARDYINIIAENITAVNSSIDNAISKYGHLKVSEVPEYITLMDYYGNYMYTVKIAGGKSETVEISPRNTMFQLSELIGTVSTLVIGYYFLRYWVWS